MRRHCTEEDPNLGMLDGTRCGMVFDDEFQDTICPHRTLPDNGFRPYPPGPSHAVAQAFTETYTTPEQPPVKNARPHIQDLVMADIAERKVQGIAKYGTALQGFNGRDALKDAYQEALDLVQYLRQALYERDLK
jgi:hypothetical protein